jgi:hypothetical protein
MKAGHRSFKRLIQEPLLPILAVHVQGRNGLGSIVLNIAFSRLAALILGRPRLLAREGYMNETDPPSKYLKTTQFCQETVGR